MTTRLRFYARGTALVEDVHAANRATRPVRRMIGRRWQEVEKGRWAWAPTGAPEEVDYHRDLVKACQDGDLWPADEATAQLCKVGFDPTFGGEATETIKDFKAKAEEPKKADAKKADDGGKGS